MQTHDTRPAVIASVIVLVCAAGCITATIVALAAMGIVYGIPPEAGDVLTYLYQINAIFCIFAAVFAADVLFFRRRRAALAKAMCWSMLLLAVMYVTPFVTETLSFLGSMAFLAAFRYACAYLPFFALIAALIAVLTTWNTSSHRGASIASMACSLCAVFCGVVYLWQVAPALAETQTQFDTAQIWAILAGYVAAIAVPVVLWFATMTEEIWIRFVTGRNSSQAAAAAEAERRLQEMRVQIEEEIQETQMKSARDEEDTNSFGADKDLPADRGAAAKSGGSAQSADAQENASAAEQAELGADSEQTENENGLPGDLSTDHAEADAAAPKPPDTDGL